MALTPLFTKNDVLQRSQVQTLEIYLKITGAKTVAPLSLINYPMLTGPDTANMTQTLVEAFLGHKSSADCATVFSSTALGTGALGFVIDMNGQCDTVLAYEYLGYQTAGGSAEIDTFLVQATQGALPGTLTKAVAAYDGDIYGVIVQTNLDSATAGFIKLKILWRSK